MIFCSLSMKLVHCATMMELTRHVHFFTYTKPLILAFSNRTLSKGNKHSLRSVVANKWERPTHLNTLNQIEDRVRLMLRKECMFLNNILRTLLNVFLWFLWNVLGNLLETLRWNSHLRNIWFSEHYVLAVVNLYSVNLHSGSNYTESRSTTEFFEKYDLLMEL